MCMGWYPLWLNTLPNFIFSLNFILLKIYAYITNLQTIVCREKEAPLPKLFYKYRESGFLNLEQTFGHILQRNRIGSQMSQK